MRKSKTGLLLALTLAVVAVFPSGCGREELRLKSTMEAPLIDSGPISGTWEEGVWVYKGIPYAAPPVGELRWREPHPVTPWKELRPCTEYGPACVQPEWPYPVGREFFNVREQSEDCLYLNVWSPAGDPNERLPVMVWIHGGGFTVGSGSQILYEGKHLAKKGVVVVTINYRLGPFGFLAHPKLSQESPRNVSGNYGLLDQIEALKWVRRNISRFGGDPQNVTIFGESAGGASVCCLMASPLADGLFHKAIVQSGGFLSMGMPSARRQEDLKEAERIGERISAALGCSAEQDELSALRSKDARQVLEAFERTAAGLMGRASIGPVVDGYVLPKAPQEVFAEGKQHRVPLLIGNNADEGLLFLGSRGLTLQQYKALLVFIYGKWAPEVEAMFPVSSDGDAREAFNRLFTSLGFGGPSRHAAVCTARLGTPVYVYLFTMRSRETSSRHMGAYHGYELPFVFGTLVRYLGEEEKRLSEAVMNYWTRFAAKGDPNGGQEPGWPRFSEDEDVYQELGMEVGHKKGYYREAHLLLKRMNDMD